MRAFMKPALARSVTILLVLKVAGLLALWFFFVRNHQVAHGVSETALHILGNITSRCEYGPS